jgi:hypothetical protein
MDRRLFVGGLTAMMARAALGASDRLPNRPKVPGRLKLRARRRRAAAPVEQTVTWEVAETGVIICDMWNDHHCKSSAERVALMAPRMNQVIAAARRLGVMIFHCPSDTMAFY